MLIKGFGFLKANGNEVSVFFHGERVVGQNWLRVGAVVWFRVIRDWPKGENK